MMRTTCGVCLACFVRKQRSGVCVQVHTCRQRQVVLGVAHQPAATWRGLLCYACHSTVPLVEAG